MFPEIPTEGKSLPVIAATLSLRTRTYRESSQSALVFAFRSLACYFPGCKTKARGGGRSGKVSFFGRGAHLPSYFIFFCLPSLSHRRTPPPRVHRFVDLYDVVRILCVSLALEAFSPLDSTGQTNPHAVGFRTEFGSISQIT